MAADQPSAFRDRIEAGRVLAGLLGAYADREGLVVLGLPRGGVPVAAQIAAALPAPLDAFVVRKLGVPGREELAMGAIASGGIRVLNQVVVDALAISPRAIDAVFERERRELERREQAYRQGRPPLDLRDRVVILVDDGLATGSTMRAAIEAVRGHEPASVVVAVPTAPPSVCEELAADVDDVVCAMTPTPFHAVGLSYMEFPEVRDGEVRALLAGSLSGADGTPPP